eukprot:1443889-Rhodomonas_salina.2
MSHKNGTAPASDWSFGLFGGGSTQVQSTAAAAGAPPKRPETPPPAKQEPRNKLKAEGAGNEDVEALESRVEKLEAKRNEGREDEKDDEDADLRRDLKELFEPGPSAYARTMPCPILTRRMLISGPGQVGKGGEDDEEKAGCCKLVWGGPVQVALICRAPHSRCNCGTDIGAAARQGVMTRYSRG